ncbi:MAG: hypothetical protein IPO09_18710 [Anaeromyxobacter sp.]|nr:hypothetical protein [Anaeromyxobacter sp.]
MLAFLGLTAVLGRRMNGSLVSGAPVFWASWTMLLAAAWVSVTYGNMQSPPDIALEYAQEGFLGAMAGSLIGIFVAGDTRASAQKTRRWVAFSALCELIVSRSTKLVVVAMATLGAVHFFDRWGSVDFDFFRILELRVAVLSEKDPGWLFRLSSYLQLVAGFLAMLAGTADAEYGVRPKRLASIWLSLVLPGLALGGRGWTLAPQLIYGLSHFLSRQCSTRRGGGLRSYLPVVVMVAIGLWFFTVIGTVRNRDLNRDQAESLTVANWDMEQRLMAVNYIGGSLTALGTIGRAAEQIGPAKGEATLDYFSRKAMASGLPFGATAAQFERWRTEDMPEEPEFGWTWCVPPTAMAYLILDFGRAGMPIALGFLVALGHWLSVRWLGQGLFPHVVAILALNAMFASTQSLVVFNPQNVFSLIFTAMAAVAVRPLAARLRALPGRSGDVAPVTGLGTTGT